MAVAVARPPELGDRRAGRSARSASRSATSSPTRPPMRSPAPAKHSSRCSSPRSSSWDALGALADAPVAFAGHSLGQVTALIASGVLPLDAGVRFAARRAELTQAAADAHPGRMAALLGATPEQADDACTAAPDACWVANDNAPGQVVIAGTPDGVAAGSARAKELGVKRVTPLNVGGAFHTPLMADATAGLAARGRRPRARRPAGAGGVEPRRRGLRRRRRLARPAPRPRLGPGPLALDHGHARRPRRHHVPRGRARLDARGARQARRPVGHRPQRRHPRRHPHDHWRSPDPWKPC